MRRVYAIGETVLDIIFRDHQVQQAKPGGAMLNSAVSLGRAGANISLISEFANDQVGLLINHFLETNNVNTQYIYRHNDGKTSIAMAFLDQKSDAGYVFYKTHPNIRLQVETPPFTSEDIVLFGSFFGIDPGVRSILFKLISAARQKGCMMVYDPNFRKPHAHELPKLLPYIKENIRMADIVRGSDEDFKIIFQADTIDQVREALGEISAPALIMTKSSHGVYLNTATCKDLFPVKKITPVSTIGAGDNFNAGIIFGLLQATIQRDNLMSLTSDQWEIIISYGVGFASDVCMSYENYISHEYAQTL